MKTQNLPSYEEWAKTHSYQKQFDMSPGKILFNNDQLSDIWHYRLEQHYLTKAYDEVSLSAILEELRSRYPDDRDIHFFGDLVNNLEVEVFSGGYKAGMTDIMTSLAMVDMQLINVEYLKLPKE